MESFFVSSFKFQVSGFKLNVKGKLILKTETLTQNVRLSEVEALLNKPAFDSALGDTKITKTETPIVRLTEVETSYELFSFTN
jgi:hypothetical protein